MALWLNDSNFITCAQKNALSQLCQLYTKLSQLPRQSSDSGQHQEEKVAALETTMSTILFFLMRAKQLQLYSDIKLSADDLSAIILMVDKTEEKVSTDGDIADTHLKTVREMLTLVQNHTTHLENQADKGRFVDELNQLNFL